MAKPELETNVQVEGNAPAIESTKQWAEHMARFGYISLGCIYVITGSLAVYAGVAKLTHPPDTFLALQPLASSAIGRFMMLFLTVGLVGLAIWEYFQAIADPESHGWTCKGLGIRLSMLFSGTFPILLAYTTTRILLGKPATGGDAVAKEWITRAMVWPLGNWLIGCVGAAFVILSIRLLYAAAFARFKNLLSKAKMSDAEEGVITALGSIGLTARSIVSASVGTLLLHAAVSLRPDKAGGFQSALKMIADRENGTLFLAALGGGLICYGFYIVLHARHRRVAALLDRVCLTIRRRRSFKH